MGEAGQRGGKSESIELVVSLREIDNENTLELRKKAVSQKFNESVEASRDSPRELSS